MKTTKKSSIERALKQGAGAVLKAGANVGKDSLSQELFSALFDAYAQFVYLAYLLGGEDLERELIEGYVSPETASEKQGGA